MIQRLGFRALVAEARRRYEAALQAQRDIDWARYGEEFRRLSALTVVSLLDA